MATTLYRIYGSNRRLIYVGITDNYDTRMRDHSEKWWWREVRAIDTADYPTRVEAKRAETVAIKTESPAYNKSEIEGMSTRRASIPRANVAPGSRRLVTIDVAADYVGVSSKTLRRRIADGSLTAYRMGKRLIRVDMAELETLMAVIPAAGSWEN